MTPLLILRQPNKPLYKTYDCREMILDFDGQEKVCELTFNFTVELKQIFNDLKRNKTTIDIVIPYESVEFNNLEFDRYIDKCTMDDIITFTVCLTSTI